MPNNQNTTSGSNFLNARAMPTTNSTTNEILNAHLRAQEDVMARQARIDIEDTRRRMGEMIGMQALEPEFVSTFQGSWELSGVDTLRVEPSEHVEQKKEPVDPEFRNTEKGKFITSERTFGVEYEINFDTNNNNALAALLPRHGIDRDGSVRDGIEVVSPILQGAAGEEQVIKACKAIHKFNGGTDDSCGLHVHYGAKDFFSEENTGTITRLSNIIDELKKPKLDYGYFILHSSVIESLLQSTLIQRRRLGRRLTSANKLDMFMLQEARDMLESFHILNTIYPQNGEMYGNEKLTFVIEPSKKIRGRITYPIPSIDEMENDKLVAYTGDPKFMRRYQRVLINLATSGKYIVLKIPFANEDLQLKRLKRLAAFYIAFDDVIASMLPLERRENDYAKRVNQKMSIEQVQSCSSMLDFFRQWMHLDEQSSMDDVRNNGRYSSRYCGLNLHALFKHGTIEIRYHEGSIDAKEILNWVALHHAIIDLAADTKDMRSSIIKLQRASTIVSLKHKTDLFFSKLKLKTQTENYFRERIKKYENDDKDTLEDCILLDESPNIH